MKSPISKPSVQVGRRGLPPSPMPAPSKRAPHPWSEDLDDTELCSWHVWEEVKRLQKRNPDLTPPSQGGAEWHY